MQIKIYGKDMTEKIHNYYFDNENPVVNVIFKGNNKKYSYLYRHIEINPHYFEQLKSNQILMYKDNNKIKLLKDICNYEEIGDGYNSTIKIVELNKTIFYKKRNISIETFENHVIQDDEIYIFEGEVKDVVTIEFSKNLAKIKFSNSETEYIIEKNRIRIVKNLKVNYKDLFDYYKYIASIKDLSSREYVENYLENQLNKIVIQNNDLLDIYLSKKNHDLKINNDVPIIYPFGINLSQREAIINALKNRVSLIQGPPGTGKTQSILNILANLIIQNKTAAVVSGNNEAIKNILEKMQNKDYGFLVALLGRKENKENFFENQIGYPNEILMWSMSQEKMEELLFEIKEHENNLLILLDTNNKYAELKQELYEYEHEYKYFSKYLQDKEIVKLKRFNFFKLNSEKLVELLVDLNFSLTDINSLVQKIRFFIQYGIYDFKQYNNITPIILDIQKQYYKQKIFELTKE